MNMMAAFAQAVATSGGGSPPPPAPVITSVTLDNTAPTVGDVITVTAIGTDCTTITYQWKADGTLIIGETGLTYTATRADAMGKAITCEAIGHNVTADSAPLESDLTATCTGAPVNTVAPTNVSNGINGPGGPALPGDTLSVAGGNVGTWTGFPVVTLFSYLWNGAVGSVTGDTYGVQNEDIGNDVKCSITGTNGIGSPAIADSNVISVVLS